MRKPVNRELSDIVPLYNSLDMWQKFRINLKGTEASADGR
jgi:hypothetical protein